MYILQYTKNIINTMSIQSVSSTILTIVYNPFNDVLFIVTPTNINIFSFSKSILLDNIILDSVINGNSSELIISAVF